MKIHFLHSPLLRITTGNLISVNILSVAILVKHKLDDFTFVDASRVKILPRNILPSFHSWFHFSTSLNTCGNDV